MEIRLINEQDDCFAISNVYEESWKSAYKGIIPQTYLDSIPKGHWAKSSPSISCLSIWEKAMESSYYKQQLMT